MRWSGRPLGLILPSQVRPLLPELHLFDQLCVAYIPRDIIDSFLCIFLSEGHDCSLYVATFSSGKSINNSTPMIRTLRVRTLPLTCLSFINENVIVGAGHDYFPMMFANDSSGW